MESNKFDKIVEKISNLLDLSKNNPNKNEAMAAALKAQELLAKYDIQLADVTHEKGKITEDVVLIKQNSGYCIKWRYNLASLIARSFKCKTYKISGNIAFYGFKKDVDVACQVFQYLFDTGNKLSNKYYLKCKQSGIPTKGVMNSFVMGFLSGLTSVLDRQSTELMIVVPKEVEDSYEEYSANFKTRRSSVSYYEGDAYDAGVVSGKAAMESRHIESRA